MNENWKQIIKRYVSLCGNHFLCDDQIKIITPIGTSNVSLNCPVCRCDSLCRLSGNCCPDVALNTCVQTSFDVDRQRNPKMLYMTNDCPHDADEVLAKKCQEANSDSNILKRIPVTSTKTNMTYSNAHCAKCNRETAFIPWLIESNCTVDAWSFTNINDLWKKMKPECNMNFIPPLEILQNHPLPKECIWENNSIDRCNITGLMATFDEKLELACESSFQEMGLFKNVFCFLCNINENPFHPPISTCNATGKINHFDKHMETKCLSNGVDLLKYPYKNEFCEECNSIKTDDGEYQFADVNITIDVYNIFQTILEYGDISKPVYFSEFTLHSLNFSFYPIVSNYIENITSSQKNSMRHYSKTHVFGQDFSWSIKDMWCSRVQSKYLSEQSISKKTCSCTRNCYEMNTCCKDPDDIYMMKQIQIWDCVKVSVPRWMSTNFVFFMISKCKDDYQNDIIRSLCESDNDHFLSYIPVTDIGASVTYKNYFCFLCVLSPQRFDAQDQPVPWKVSLHCPIPFNFKNEETLEGIFKQGLSRKCKFNFKPSSRRSPPAECQISMKSSLYCSLCVYYPDELTTIVVGGGYRSIFSLYDNTDETVQTNINMLQGCSQDQVFDRRQV